MNQTTLYIIGNGFDLHHGIASCYEDFKVYLFDHDKPLYDLVVEYLPVKETWADLESKLAHLDMDLITDEAMNCLQPYSADDWSDSFHHDYQYEINKVVNSLSNGLKARFIQWLLYLKIPNPEDVICPLLNIDKNGLFLTFNYTSTLESVYKIPKNNILFIHGESAEEGSEIILGHAWDPEEIPDLNDVSNPEDMDTRIMEGNEILNNYFRATFKPTDKIIVDNKLFFNQLCQISKVYILGHSLSDVDFPYFLEVTNNVPLNSEWKVSYYVENELEKHKITMRKLGVKNIEFKKLQDIWCLKNKKQHFQVPDLTDLYKST